MCNAIAIGVGAREVSDIKITIANFVLKIDLY